ncbi:hypothetical protein SAMN05444166_6045 [Singulisphaera sp. GP187]|uniref:hypothetical protein n=1 Tax=Singulisphaera sp. GP187 TaxID=1882752 RepID=UPI00092B01D0|nr:hypothetical protein [Singulisphaera sp. GP187]SIO59420.1 hypothetical protein SAMN05444166_6045 [Singulisphaera sp. GP187]
MALQTEAECLLDTGVLYGVRVMLRPPLGDPIFAGFKQGAFSLYYGDGPIYHFDREGRWQRAFIHGIHYLKGLDTTIQAIDRVREGVNMVLKRRTLFFAEASDLDASIRATALDLLEALSSGRLKRADPPSKAQPLSSDELYDFLGRIVEWDATAWFAHREKYLATYGVLPFLPPDSQNALILQATLGHADGIAFGGGAAAPHYQRSIPEFATHTREVAKLYGQRLLQYRTLFLAGSDVLRRPNDEIVALLETIARSELCATTGEAPRLEAVHAFLDNLASPRPTLEQWRTYRQLQLRRVTLGVESGDPTVRGLYRKAWENSDLVALVSDLKQADIAIGLMVLIDAGGAEHAERHLAATADLINTLELGKGDIVSLLDANEFRDPEQQAPNVTPLAGLRWTEQQAALKHALLPLRSNRGVKVVPYSLEKQGL